MASLRKRGDFWYIRFRDETGKQSEKKASRDKGVARSMMKAKEDRLTGIRMGTLDPDEISACEAEQVPIQNHVADYVAWLEAKGRVPDHVSAVKGRLEWLLEETKITRLSQLRPEVVDIALKVLRDAGKADNTLLHCVSGFKAFTRWLQKNGRSKKDLLAKLDRPSVTTERRREPLTPEQATRLITSTRTGPNRRGLTGEDRSWLYTLAIYTGFRRSELQSLTPESFNLDASPPIVSLPGRDTKNSKQAVQPLPSHAIPALRAWLASKTPSHPIWAHNRNSALMIRADLRAAGIPPDDFDFHGLRHLYVTQIVGTGANVKDSMTLARHSDADLTFNRYSHTRLADLAGVVNQLPDLWGGTATCPHPAHIAAPTGPNGSLSTHQNGSTVASQVVTSRHVFQSGCLDSPDRNPSSRNGQATHPETLSHALPTLSSEDPDLALIVGLWDRLADQIKAKLMEVIWENMPSED